MLDELQRLNARIEEAEQDQQTQGRYADRFPRGRDGRIILYGGSGDDRRGVDDGGDSGDGGDPSDDDDDQFFDARNYVDQPRRPRRLRHPQRRRRPAIINQQDLDDIRDQQEDLRQQQQSQDLQQQLLNQRRAQQQEEEELFNQQVQQQQQQERLNQLLQRLIQLQPQAQAQAQPQPQAQQDAITALQQQLAQERERTVALQNQNRESQRLNKEIQREQQAQREILTEPVSSSSTSSVVGDLASAVGDLSSASASALGKLASSGVSNLVVKPLKGAADIIKSSFTPSTTSTPSVRSSDVFPESQYVRSSDVFPGLVTPNQTGIWSSTHPSFSMSSSPYPMEYKSDLASQAAAIRSAQQAAQLMSVPRVQSSSFNPASSLPSSHFTLPQSSGLEYPSTIPSSSLTLQPATSFNPSTIPSSSLTLQPASSFNPSTIPSSSLTFPQESTTLPSSSLVYPSQTLSASNILPPQPQSQSQDYNDFQQMQNLFLPPLDDLDQYDTRYLTQLSPQLDQQVQSVTGKINGMKRKKNPTPEYQNEIRRFSKYKKDLVNYRNTFREQLNYRYQTGTGIWNKSPIIFNNTTPQELLNRLELLGGSLAAGNNGVLPEYIQIAHRLRDLGVISNKQLNKMLKKVCKYIITE